jgi:antitoxin component YwqK of YwqJK toxin-antitoxin module
LGLLSLVALGLVVESARRLGEARRGLPAPSEVSAAYLARVDGRLRRAGSTQPFTGWMIERHPDGAVKSRSLFVGGLREGLLEEWHPNGALHVRQHFHADLADGSRETWYPTGQKMSEGSFAAGRPQRDYRRWHENGRLAVQARFKDGKPDGLSYAWHPSGFLRTEALMREGEPVERHFYEDGRQRQPMLLSQTSNP